MIDILVLATGLMSALLSPEGELPLVRGARCAGRIYVGGTWSHAARRPMTSGGECHALLSADCDADADRNVYFLPFSASIIARPPSQVPLRWQIHRDRYYVIDHYSSQDTFAGKDRPVFITCRPFLKSCTLSTIDAWSPRAFELSRPELIARRDAFANALKLQGLLEWMLPLPPPWVKQWGDVRITLPNDDSHPSTAPFNPADFLVADDGTIEEYVLMPNKILKCFRRGGQQDGRHVFTQASPYMRESAELWATEGLTAFRAVSSKESRYLIGHFDQVYKLEKRPGFGTGIIRQIRRATFLPALAAPSVLISDAEHGKHYLFMAHRYFEIADPIVERPHRVSISGKLGTPSENLSVVQDCFRAVDEIRPGR